MNSSEPPPQKPELTLRGKLALDRTRLANERTLLAYVRSALALAIAGVSIMYFAEEQWFWLTGLTCIPLAFAMAIVGTLRFRRTQHAITKARAAGP